MPADGLDGCVIEMTRVAHQSTDNVVCVLETIKDVLSHRELRTLAQLHTLILALGVDVLDPAVVVLDVVVLDVLLEDNHVRVGDGFGVC